MTMKKRIWSILSQARCYQNRWRVLERKNFSLACYDSFNLEKRLFLQNVHRKYSSVPELSISNKDKKKFLKHLMDARSFGKSQEFKDIIQNHKIQKLIDKRLAIIEDIKSLEDLEKDKEMQKIAEEEKLGNEKELEQVDNKILELALENFCTDNFSDVILEITAGVGGQEAMLFVKNLSEMYIKHLSYLGYNYDIIEIDESDQGGFRHLSIMVSGYDAFKKLRHEAGVHRVQRVPATEKSGRMHTSVASVAVLPQPSDIEVSIDEKDLRIDVMRASGAGGQHVNTTNSAVRITHLPTGIVAECQTDKSQIKNRSLAMAKLRARIYQKELDRQLSSATSMRKKQMGMGERNEKIRTYNYSQDRVTDHRLSNGTLHNLKGFMLGGEALDKIHGRLHQQLMYELFAEAINSI